MNHEQTTIDSSAIRATMDAMTHEMHALQPTGNNEADFAAMMISHHKGAVAMSRVLLEKGTNAEMKDFAQKVIADQDKEISFMEDFIKKSSKAPSPNAAAFQKALNGSMHAMVENTTPRYNDPDEDYAAQMIPHHQSAVDMARVYLEYGKDTLLRTLCENIINSQSGEISWLRAWLETSR